MVGIGWGGRVCRALCLLAGRPGGWKRWMDRKMGGWIHSTAQHSTGKGSTCRDGEMG
jgi:hypothetical protein